LSPERMGVVASKSARPKRRAAEKSHGKMNPSPTKERKKPECKRKENAKKRKCPRA